MKEPKHYYPRFGVAITIVENSLTFSKEKELSMEHFKYSLQNGLSQFRIKPTEGIDGKEKVRVTPIKQKKGDTKNFIYLASWVITNDQKAQGLYAACEDLQSKKENNYEELVRLKLTYSPLSGEYNNGKSRHTAKATLYENLASAITTVSPNKPALTIIDYSGNNPSYTNTAIIPDLPIDEMIAFIKLFQKIKFKEIEGEGIFSAKVKVEEKGKGKSQKKVYSLKREGIRVYRGNFPNAPYHHTLNALALLGAMGYWAKRAETREETLHVLESLKGCSIYLVSYGHGEVTSFHQYAVELAKKDELAKIINSCYGINIYSESKGKKCDRKNSNYNLLYLFFSRFLQLFTTPAFKDFLATRAEYPAALAPLFIIYFSKVENMDLQIINAAKAYGQQLNFVAFLAAKAAEAEDKKKSQPGKFSIWERKARALVELESAVYSARSETALFAQLSTRAARLIKGGFEMSADAEPFISAALAKQVGDNDANNLEKTKHLVITFLRLRSKKQKEESPVSDTSTDYQEAFEALGIADDEDHKEI